MPPQTVTVAASYGRTIGGGWFAMVDSETTETCARPAFEPPIDPSGSVADQSIFCVVSEADRPHISDAIV